MIEKIWKYKLNPGLNEIELPQWSSLVHTGCDPTGDPCAWFQVDPNPEATEKPSITELRVVATGESFDGKQWAYHSSIHQGPFIWHVLTWGG